MLQNGFEFRATSSARRSWRRAVATVNRARAEAGRPLLPARLWRYQLRHSFGTGALRTKDLAATGHLLLHSDPRQTLRYVKAAIPDGARAIADRLTDLPVPSADKRKRVARGKKSATIRAK
ncbi:MAG: hypothetical protein LC775_00735 [Acidobacteria bacterium]|nr:hypothetical protein [Acidobacteriota bacterium]